MAAATCFGSATRTASRSAATSPAACMPVHTASQAGAARLVDALAATLLPGSVRTGNGRRSTGPAALLWLRVHRKDQPALFQTTLWKSFSALSL